ncbi:MAG: GntP family permease [Marinilabiliaceae bacterium]
MIDVTLLLGVLSGIALLLVLILYFRLQAFISLLIASITVGILAGMAPEDIISTMQKGMGETLGFVAVIVGLGAMFGAILENSGGAEALASYLLGKFGEKRASWAMMLTGFFVAIPVFFDVGFIILMPLVYSLQRKTGKSLLLYGLPLLAGLAITHAFIPPTPGPVAVAEIIGANLGWVILFGLFASIPSAIIGGPMFARYVSKKIHIDAPHFSEEETKITTFPAAGLVLAIIGVPIILIVANTLLTSPLFSSASIPSQIKSSLGLLGHPFAALILANLLAWYLLGVRRKLEKEKLLRIMTQSMGPAGIIILLTGAGGVFKQMLVDTGTGEMLASWFAESGAGILLFAFVAAALVRILQGSATVAMITAAGLTAPLLGADIGEADKALLVIAIASGATIMSHVNDSGFWLVGKYLKLTEKQTFQSWTAMTTVLALTGFATTWIISIFV